MDPLKPRRARRGSGAVTLHEVARLAGVAPITASRALNKPQLVSDEVRRKVAEAVAQTGYVPNLLAGGLASTRSRLVAAVVPTLTGPVFLPTVAALTEALAAEGCQLMLGQTGYDVAREDALLEAIIGRRPDGLVLTGTLRSEAARRRLRAAGFPVVETWDLAGDPIDMLVGFSHEAVGRAVARHLHARGRRRLALIGGDDPRARRRAAAFADEAARLGLDPVQAVEVPAPTTLRSGRAGLRQLLGGATGQAGAGGTAGTPSITGTTATAASAARPDAVFCSSDLLALGVLLQAQADGLRLPQDLAVIGFGDLDFAADTLPALSTVRIDGPTIGRHAAACIVARAGGDAGPRVIDVGFRIVSRDSD
ncbi:MAG: hypothetical protein RL223_1212 [Pseudomonadota bacterium]